MLSRFDSINTSEGCKISNAPIISMAPLIASMDIYHKAGMGIIRDKGGKYGYLHGIFDSFNIFHQLILLHLNKEDANFLYLCLEEGRYSNLFQKRYSL